MEIILKQDVEGLGFKDDLINVKPGYGRNYLIPKGIGILATNSQKKVLAENLRQRKHKEESIVDKANRDAENIKSLDIKITAKVGKEGKLFGSVSNSALAGELARNGIDLDKKFIQIPGKTIRNTGKFSAIIRLHREVIVDIEFEVVPEK